MQDFEDILEMFEDYKRDPRPMDQEPRNMYSQGQLVSNTVDGSRPGYNGNPGALKVFNKALDSFYNEFDKEVVDAASIQDHGVTFDKLKGEDKRRNFKFYFKQDMKDYGEYIGTENPNKDRRTMKRNIRATREAKIKLNIIEATKEGKPLNVKKFIKNNDITVKELKKQTKALQTNIYIKRSLASGKDSSSKLFWLTDDLNATDNVLKTLTKQKLIINDADNINNIMFNAFGREFEEGTTNVKNPNYNIKKYSAIQKNLSEYQTLNKYIDKTYGIKTELDHPLSKKIIRQLMNGTPEELSRVNILEKNLNQQFKNQLNMNYSKAVDSGNIKQKRAVEKIAKKFKLNIGSVPDDQFFDVSKIDRGALSFEKLDIKKEMLKSLKNAASLDTEFLKYIKENPGVFEDAKINISKIVKPKNVANIAKNLPEIEKYLNSTVAKGGSKGKAAAQALAIIIGTTGGAMAGDDSEGLSGTETAAIGGGAAATLATKTGRKVLGNLLNAAGVPLSIGINAAIGIDPKSSLDRSILAGELALAPGVVQGATSVTDKIKNPLTKKIAQTLAGVRIPGLMNPANAMKIARYASPLGIASLAGEAIYNVGKLGYEDQKRFNALSPEEQVAERAEQEKFASDIEGS